MAKDKKSPLPQTGQPRRSALFQKRYEVFQIINISRDFRRKYKFEEPFSVDFQTARFLAQKINQQRKSDSGELTGQPVRASGLNAMALIEEILRYVVHLYQKQRNPEVFSDLDDWLKPERAGIDRILGGYLDAFPPLEVFHGRTGIDHYLTDHAQGVTNRHLAFQNLIMLRLANNNPAYAPYGEFFDDTKIEKQTSYRALIAKLHDFFDTQPRFGPDEQNLLELLRSPAVASPNSLFGQLEYIRHRWGDLLGRYLWRLLSSLDFIREEGKVRLPLPDMARVYEFKDLEEEERFSPDKEWMPQLVLMAKSALVWLDQLSRKYGRSIRRLDQIPDEELDLLAGWGFTGLWLIGIWERSGASKKIKQKCGNPEALASAYSVVDYAAAGELGGEAALENLKSRCLQRGIRLASDMVPNHTGLNSPWIVEHPDWYIGLDAAPFPSYSFEGANLSEDGRLGIFIEDHYYDRSDAAVVFKWMNHQSGEVRYIYHGNDGTHLPWNDTAQLNYLNPQTREAVIQTILQVARRFPIIRFDAAMTLTKKHYQRLWFPEPGSGGDIPSRSEHSMTRQQFNRLMPQEFWREVVDRIAQEAPDTLLLAEAFWLMEGYFVRTLGMHRVYNSAFMNMLKNEENKNYRSLIKNTLEFDPEILKRYVNFMNNPDEETAVVQFGKGDKYFGVCFMMATMPGLALFGHGQVEGLHEKYGMEYSRAYWDEQPDQELVRRHEREIFPLLKKRTLFSGVENFLLYDLYMPGGRVNENVFIYSNCSGSGRALLLYNNKYEETRGWIKLSAAYAEKGPDGRKTLNQKTLAQGLALTNDHQTYCIFREMVSGLQYVRHNQAIWDNGLYVEMSAYQYQAFMEFKEVKDNALHHYADLCASLNGRGVLDINDALIDIGLRPIQRSFSEAYNTGIIRSIMDDELDSWGLEDAEFKVMSFYQSIAQFSELNGDEAAMAREFRSLLEYSLSPDSPLRTAGTGVQSGQLMWSLLVCWLILTAGDSLSPGHKLIDDLRLEWVIRPVWENLGLTVHESTENLLRLRILLRSKSWLLTPQPNLPELLEDREVKELLRVNRSRGLWWFNKEAFERLLWWLDAVRTILDRSGYGNGGRKAAALPLPVQAWRAAAGEAEYQWERLLELLHD